MFGWTFLLYLFYIRDCRCFYCCYKMSIQSISRFRCSPISSRIHSLGTPQTEWEAATAAAMTARETQRQIKNKTADRIRIACAHYAQLSDNLQKYRLFLLRIDACIIPLKVRIESH